MTRKWNAKQSLHGYAREKQLNKALVVMPEIKTHRRRLSTRRVRAVPERGGSASPIPLIGAIIGPGVMVVHAVRTRGRQVVQGRTGADGFSGPARLRKIDRSCFVDGSGGPCFFRAYYSRHGSIRQGQFFFIDLLHLCRGRRCKHRENQKHRTKN